MSEAKAEVSEYVKQLEQQAQVRKDAERQAKTQDVLTRVNQAAEDHSNLENEGSGYVEQIKGLNVRLANIEESLKHVAQKRSGINTSPILLEEPDIMQEALAELNKEEEELNQEKKQIQQKMQAAAEAHKQVSVSGAALRGEIRPLIGVKEVPQKTIDEVWKYVQYEREESIILRDYIKNLGEQLADRYIYEIAVLGTQQNPFIKEIGKNSSLLQTPLGGYIPALSPKLFNAFLDAFRTKMSSVITGKEFEGIGYGKKVSLNEEQVQKLKQAKIILVIQDKQYPIWDPDGGALKLQEPVPLCFGDLTQNQKLIVASSVKDLNIDKDTLLKKLELSEYDEGALGQIVDEAKAWNTEFNQQQFNKKQPDIQKERERVEQELEKITQEKANLETVLGCLKEIKKIQNTLSAIKTNIKYYEAQIVELERRKKKWQDDYKSLARYPKILGVGGGIKDRVAERQLAGQIEDTNNGITNSTAHLKTETENLEKSQTELAGKISEIKLLAPEAIGVNGEIVWDTNETHNKVWEKEREISTLTGQLQTLNQTEVKWKDNKYLLASMEEMQFLVPEYGNSSKLDLLANNMAKQMEGFFNTYTLWDILPETTWTVNKKGNLSLVEAKSWAGKIEGASFYGQMPGKDYEQMKNLHSQNLVTILEDKIRVQLGKKYPPQKIGALHFVYQA